MSGKPQKKISIIGSGNWGSTIGKIIGINVASDPCFQDEVQMWVFDEIIDGKKLSETINETHINVKYLPGHKLPSNLKAVPDVVECTKDADVLIFVLPHQFMEKVIVQMKPHVKKSAVAVSLIKGLHVNAEGNIALLSDMIRDQLGIKCGVLMGANLANEVAQEKFCEATIGIKDLAFGRELKQLLQTDYFRLTVVEDDTTTELCGALKNIIALGAGIAHAMGYGDNTLSALIRIGFMEMKTFIFNYFGYRQPNESTLMQSCGFADMITTCYGGRNRRIGEALALHPEKTIPDLERELLNGQSAQGPLTAEAVFRMLDKRNDVDKFPLMVGIYRVCQRELPAKELITCLQDHPEHKD